MEFNTLFYLSIMLFCGLAVARLLKQIKMPNVTGYLVAGLIIGPSVLGIIPENIVAEFSIISDIALFSTRATGNMLIGSRKLFPVSIIAFMSIYLLL